MTEPFSVSPPLTWTEELVVDRSRSPLRVTPANLLSVVVAISLAPQRVAHGGKKPHPYKPKGAAPAGVSTHAPGRLRRLCYTPAAYRLQGRTPCATRLPDQSCFLRNTHVVIER